MAVVSSQIVEDDRDVLLIRVDFQLEVALVMRWTTVETSYMVVILYSILMQWLFANPTGGGLFKCPLLCFCYDHRAFLLEIPSNYLLYQFKKCKEPIHAVWTSEEELIGFDTIRAHDHETHAARHVFGLPGGGVRLRPGF